MKSLFMFLIECDATKYQQKPRMINNCLAFNSNSFPIALIIYKESVRERKHPLY